MIVPDTKDWTWVLDAPCPECGFVAAEVAGLRAVAEQVARNAGGWRLALAAPGSTTRPAPGVWSPTAYAAHVRDVHTIFAGRVRLMLDQDAPTFPDWDQDATAVEERYDLADPARVGEQVVAAATLVADLYDAVPDAARVRSGLRGDGSAFTVDSIARYHLHDVVHHLWDVRRQVTVASYDAQARAYRAATASPTGAVETGLDDVAARLGPGARVLEIGSGGGRDALALERRGLRVRRTDVTPGFVDLLRADGHHADVLDPLTDDLLDPRTDGHQRPYDGVWANASLLHVARADLSVVLARVAAVTRTGGVLRLSVKEGDGEAWSTHGSIEAPRMFTYWREPDLVRVVTGAGWRVADVVRSEGMRAERWLSVVAYRGSA